MTARAARPPAVSRLCLRLALHADDRECALLGPRRGVREAVRSRRPDKGARWYRQPARIVDLLPGHHRRPAASIARGACAASGPRLAFAIVVASSRALHDDRRRCDLPTVPFRRRFPGDRAPQARSDYICRQALRECDRPRRRRRHRLFRDTHRLRQQRPHRRAERVSTGRQHRRRSASSSGVVVSPGVDRARSRRQQRIRVVVAGTDRGAQRRRCRPRAAVSRSWRTRRAPCRRCARWPTPGATAPRRVRDAAGRRGGC